MIAIPCVPQYHAGHPRFGIAGDLAENLERFADGDFWVFLGSGRLRQTDDWQEDGKSDDH